MFDLLCVSVMSAILDYLWWKKVFKSLSGSTVKAVDGVSFKAYKGQITALLGHNGAGKSTTMNVLTGMLSPSDGSAQINGFNIGNEMNMVGFFY